ncbi:hypothetical protein, partial [Streptococcus sp. 2021WUSS124]|uniref:hypothetical protein n=1 Tax=unclassified Streptococcus TaxID=2608887 RepID=UPI0037AACE6D
APHSIIPQYEKVRKKYIQKFDKKIALYQRLEHFCVIQTVKLPIELRCSTFFGLLVIVVTVKKKSQSIKSATKRKKENKNLSKQDKSRQALFLI